MHLQGTVLQGSGYIKLPLSNFHFLILYFCECGASFEMSQIGINAYHTGHKVAIFTVRTPYQPPKFENVLLNLSEFWCIPKAASCPIGLLMINIVLIPFQHTQPYTQNVEVSFVPGL